MSCDYHVWCVTCGVSHEFNDANHQDRLMQSLIDNRSAIASLVPLVATNNVDLTTSWGLVNPQWFEKHAGHELAVRDEYGRIHERACERCPATGVTVSSVLGRYMCEECGQDVQRFVRERRSE